MKSGWKMDEISDQKFVDAIGNQIQLGMSEFPEMGERLS